MVNLVSELSTSPAAALVGWAHTDDRSVAQGGLAGAGRVLAELAGEFLGLDGELGDEGFELGDADVALVE